MCAIPHFAFNITFSALFRMPCHDFHDLCCDIIDNLLVNIGLLQGILSNLASPFLSFFIFFAHHPFFQLKKYLIKANQYSFSFINIVNLTYNSRPPASIVAYLPHGIYTYIIACLIHFLLVIMYRACKKCQIYCAFLNF